MPRVLAVGFWNLDRGAGCGDAESSSNRTESDLVPESESGSMNRDRGTAYRSPFPATMLLSILFITSTLLFIHSMSSLFKRNNRDYYLRIVAFSIKC